MVRLKKYIEWMSRGRRTNRIAYVMKERDLPTPVPGAEWRIDEKFSAADVHNSEGRNLPSPHGRLSRVAVVCPKLALTVKGPKAIRGNCRVPSSLSRCPAMTPGKPLVRFSRKGVKNPPSSVENQP